MMGTDTILFVGAHYEVKNGSEITKYYMAGSTRIAMRKYTIPQNMTVEYLLSDHLGSTSLTTDVNGAKVLELRYKAWGEVRATWTSSPSTTPAYKMPLYTYTGQASYMDDPTTSGVTEGFGLMFYNARWYDPALGRFAQADTVIPGGAQGYHRYAYFNNNPVNGTDPTGHVRVEDPGSRQGCTNKDYCINGKPKVYPPRNPKGPMCYGPSVCTKPVNNWLAYNAKRITSYGISTADYLDNVYLTATKIAATNSGLHYTVSGSTLYGLNGGFFSASRVNGAVAQSFTGWGALGMSAATALGTNLLDYGVGAHADIGIMSQEFAVSTVVDTAIGYAVGAGAALLVGAAIGTAAGPIALVVGTAVVATGAMLVLDSYGVPDMATNGINSFIDTLQGE